MTSSRVRFVHLKATQNRHLKWRRFVAAGTTVDHKFVRHRNAFDLAGKETSFAYRLPDNVNACAGKFTLDPHVEDSLPRLVSCHAAEDEPQVILAWTVVLAP